MRHAWKPVCSRHGTADRQPGVMWLKTNRHLNKMYVGWLDSIEDFRSDVTHLPGSRNPMDPLSRCGFDGRRKANCSRGRALTPMLVRRPRLTLGSRSHRESPAHYADVGD